MERLENVFSRRFLLELWLEPRQLIASRLGLRGRVQDLESGYRRGVSSLHDVEEFIDEAFGEAGAPPHQWGDQP